MRVRADDRNLDAAAGVPVYPLQLFHTIRSR